MFDISLVFLYTMLDYFVKLLKSEEIHYEKNISTEEKTKKQSARFP